LPKYDVFVYPHKFEVFSPFKGDPEVEEFCRDLNSRYRYAAAQAAGKFEDYVSNLHKDGGRKKLSRDDLKKFLEYLSEKLEEQGCHYLWLRSLEAANEEEAKRNAVFFAARFLPYDMIIGNKVPWGSIQYDYEIIVYPEAEGAILDPPRNGETQFPWGLLAVFGIAAAIPVAWSIFNGLGR